MKKIGIDRAKAEAEVSDLIILVLDASTPLDKDDEELINLCKSLNKKTITLLNKIDLATSRTGECLQSPRTGELREPILFSTKTKAGLPELLSTIEKMFINKELDFNNEIFISNERQLQSIKNAKSSLQNVLTSIDKDMPEDLLTIDLTDAYTHLSQVLGIEVTDDLVNEIFSKFCMGK